MVCMHSLLVMVYSVSADEICPRRYLIIVKFFSSCTCKPLDSLVSPKQITYAFFGYERFLGILWNRIHSIFKIKPGNIRFKCKQASHHISSKFNDHNYVYMCGIRAYLISVIIITKTAQIFQTYVICMIKW